MHRVSYEEYLGIYMRLCAACVLLQFLSKMRNWMTQVYTYFYYIYKYVYAYI